MKYVIAIIRTERLKAVQDELQRVEVSRITISNVSGHGRQEGHMEVYRGFEKQVTLIEKTKIEIAVNDDFLKPTIKAIIKGARTDHGQGSLGDGKIFVLPLEEVIRISDETVGKEAI